MYHGVLSVRDVAGAGESASEAEAALGSTPPTRQPEIRTFCSMQSIMRVWTMLGLGCVIVRASDKGSAAALFVLVYLPCKITL